MDIASRILARESLSYALAGLSRVVRAAVMLGCSVHWGVVVAATYECLIEATQTAEIASPVTGLLETVTVRRGDRVAKGQVVALLDSRAEQAAAELARFRSEQLGPTLMAESKIEFSRRKFNRRRDMVDERLMAPQERDDAEGELKLAEAELQVAKENRQIARIEFKQQSSLVNLRTIRSPLDGVVVDQMAVQGEVVEPGGNKKGIVKLAQLDPLRIHVILPRSVFGKARIGMTADVRPETPAKGSYVAKVKNVDQLIDGASGTFVIYLEMPNPKLEIPAGVKCKVTFPALSNGAAVGAREMQVLMRKSGADSFRPG